MLKINNFMKKIIMSNENKTGMQKFLNSLWAIFFGILISSIFILIIGRNPFIAFQELIKGAASSKKITWTFFAIYSFGAMAVGIAFKAGLFNIGVPGQMMAGGISAYFVIQSLGTPNTGNLIIGMICAILMSILITLFVGILKSFFNVHEVVSTIMLNWIIFYVGKHIFRPGTRFNSNSYEESITFSIQSSIFNSNSSWIFSIIFVIFISLGLFFIIKKTTIGYKIKSIGMNRNASKYSGFHDKMIILGTLSLSGALAGISGFFYYIVKTKGLINFTSGAPLSYGFDTIAISLLAFNSMIGIPLSSILFSYLQTGSINWQYSKVDIGPDFLKIIVGIIIYLSSISIIFQNFKPTRFLIRRLLFFIFPEYRKKIFNYVKEYKEENKKNKLNIIKSKKYYLENKKKLIFETKKVKNKLKVLSNKIIQENVDSLKLKKIYSQSSKLKWEIIELKDQYGKTKYKENCKNSSLIRKKLFQNIFVETNKYNEKLKLIFKQKYLSIRKRGK